MIDLSNEPIRVLSFDIEDWFHVLDNRATRTEAEWQNLPSLLEQGVARILDMLEAHGQSATFFILGWVAREFPSLVAEIARQGHHIGCHSHMHQLIYEQSPDEFEDDLKLALDTIGNITGVACDAYRAPGFSLTRDCIWAFEILARHGIVHDSSLFLTNRAHGGFSGYPVLGPSLLRTESGATINIWPVEAAEIAGSSVMMAGGGYFRIIPAVFLRREFARTNYLMTYFHPRDFEPELPRVPGVSSLRHFKLNVGVGRSMNKLSGLLKNLSFVSLLEAHAHVVHRPEVSIHELR